MPNDHQMEAELRDVIRQGLRRHRFIRSLFPVDWHVQHTDNANEQIVLLVMATSIPPLT